MQPPTLAQTRRFTCRYWALGPACPNVTRTGSIFCKYSHYDTGQLAGPFAQTGTCLNWSKHGVCYRFGCTYEHRNTGVTGLGQGGRKSIHSFRSRLIRHSNRTTRHRSRHRQRCSPFRFQHQQSCRALQPHLVSEEVRNQTSTSNPKIQSSSTTPTSHLSRSISSFWSR